MLHEPPSIQAERTAHATSRSANVTDSQRAVAGIGASNVIRTLVRHPDLLNAWLGLGTKLLFSERLPTRERELVVLRVARRTLSAYEWGGHALGAQAAGLTAAEIRAVLDDTYIWRPPGGDIKGRKIPT